MANRKSFWIGLSLINLCIVALLGFTLRSKILFPIEHIDFRNFLSAHSHFAFGGWVGLVLITMLIYDLLPPELSNKKKYNYVLWGIEITSLGMAFSFPFSGYSVVSVLFSSLYIFVFLAFAWFFVYDIIKIDINNSVRLLGVSAIISAIVSFLGPLGLVYILLSRSGSSILYRDSIYTFLHFQYNGFFTLSVFTLLLNQVLKSRLPLPKFVSNFCILLCLSVPTTLFLALLWHNKLSFYIIAIVGCILNLMTLLHFFRLVRRLDLRNSFPDSLARILLQLSLLSFTVKMVLQIGTVVPPLGNAVYGDRPVIIGFLHLVFLGFVTFYILSTLTMSGYFRLSHKNVKYPIMLFSSGIILNELLLMLQGFGILLRMNSNLFSWLLWLAALILFIGALAIAITALRKIFASSLN